MRTCEWCEAKFTSATRGRPPKYCGQPCRQAAHRDAGAAGRARRRDAATLRERASSIDAQIATVRGRNPHELAPVDQQRVAAHLDAAMWALRAAADALEPARLPL